MSNQIEQIRAEIERRISENTFGAKLELIDLLAWLDTLPADEGKILPKLREFLATATPEELAAKYRELEYLLAPKDDDADADKAAEKYGRDTFINECMENGSCDANDLADAFKAGIAYERERLMKEAVEGEIVKDISGKLGVTAKVNLDGFKFGEKVRVIIEEIK